MGENWAKRHIVRKQRSHAQKENIQIKREGTKRARGGLFWAEMSKVFGGIHSSSQNSSGRCREIPQKETTRILIWKAAPNTAPIEPLHFALFAVFNSNYAPIGGRTGINGEKQVICSVTRHTSNSTREWSWPKFGQQLDWGFHKMFKRSEIILFSDILIVNF